MPLRKVQMDHGDCRKNKVIKECAEYMETFKDRNILML
jgi:hypothetical protein